MKIITLLLCFLLSTAIFSNVELKKKILDDKSNITTEVLSWFDASDNHVVDIYIDKGSFECDVNQCVVDIYPVYENKDYDSGTSWVLTIDQNLNITDSKMTSWPN